MSNAIYNPISHFFVNQAALMDADDNNKADDAFGPVENNETTQYRTTSFVRADTAIAASERKVFAICAGRVLIQPNADDPTKVNLILKPDANYAPIKIKYFIYRGVNKTDLIANDDSLMPIDELNSTQPAFLQSLWKVFESYNVSIPGTLLPIVFLAEKIGYNILNLSTTLLIDEVFNQYEGDTYQLPQCDAGMHLGYFADRIGLDIVLDDGDYQLEHQKELFKFDLTYAQKNDHFFDISTLMSPTETEKARYREYILRFMDAAAFWGSHIHGGKIKDINDIFTHILNKYQTKHTVYIHILAEKGRSYGYYDFSNQRKIAFGLNETNLNTEKYQTSNWPIFSRTYPSSSESAVFCSFLKYEGNVSITLDIITPYINILKNVPKSNTPLMFGDSEILGQLYASEGNLYSSFIFIHCNLKQTGTSKYYNELWTVNIKSTFSLPPDNDSYTSWCTYDRTRIVNLDDISLIDAVIQNRVVFDTGKNKDLTPTTKKRRLYIAAVKKNIGFGSIDVDVESFTSCFYYGLSDTEYIYCLYDYDNDFSVCKGTFTDGAETIHALTLTHEKNSLKSRSFFQLGVTEEEYDTVIADLPADADNVFFHLEEIFSFVHPSIKKYKLGVQYENDAGTITPLVSNDVFVYTLDGFYFFSKDFSAYQHVAELFPKANAVFGIRQSYAGEFGFDWMRKGKTNIFGDIAYENNVGKLYTDSAHTNLVMDPNESDAFFNPILSEYKKLEQEYKFYFVQYDSDFEKYFIPLLTIYPKYPANIIRAGGKDLDRQTIFNPYSDAEDKINRVAKLQLTVNNIVSPTKLELQYNKDIFIISLPETELPAEIELPVSTGVPHYIDFDISCKKEFDIEQEIRVVASYDTKKVTVGRLRVSPNAKYNRHVKKVVFIDVITNIRGASPPPDLNFPLDQHAKHLKKFLRQILTTPIIETDKINLIANSDPVFNSNYIYTDPSLKKYILGNNAHTPITPDANLYDFLYKKLPPAKQAKYAKYIKIYFFHDEGGAIKSSGSFKQDIGYAYGIGNVIIFFDPSPVPDPSTTTHEFLHTLQLQHTFANQEAHPCAKHTYRPLRTDNIMDYSNLPDHPTVSLYEWQWKTVKRYLDSETEN